jgi:hypothetical protein
MPPPIPSPRPLPVVVLSRDIGYDAARSAHRAGELLRVRPGAYLHGGLPAAPWARRETLALAHCVAVARQLRSRPVLSHESAALVHGAWLTFPRAVTHVAVSSPPHKPDIADIRRHYSPDLSEDEITVVGGLHVTSLERTALDCALTLPARRALPVVDSILRMLARPNRFDRARSDSAMAAARDSLRARLAELGRRSGVVRARAVVEHADGFSESPGETDLRWIAVSRGLPGPVLQLRVVTADGDYYTDMGWEFDATSSPTTAARGVAAEFDGAGKYTDGSGPGSLFAEKQREDAIRMTAFLMHRFVDRHLRDPDAAFARLCRGFPSTLLDAIRPVPALMQLPRTT